MGEFPVTMSVLSFIRNHAKLPGTKFSCLEGGCGACLIVVKGIHPITKALRIYSVNSVSRHWKNVIVLVLTFSLFLLGI